MIVRIQIRRGTATEWTTANPTLSSGEFGYETNTGKLKIGNGATAWNALSYLESGTGGGDSAYVYIAYASDDTGTGFTNTFNPSLDYVAIKSTTSPIITPIALDFTGLWKNYKGEPGSDATATTDASALTSGFLSPDRVQAGSLAEPKLNASVNQSLDAANSSMNTGIIFGGDLSINAIDATKIDISAGAGYVVDDTVTPATISYVEWNAFISVTLTDLATKNSTDIAINSAGSIVQQRSFTNEELRSVIFLGGVDHAGGTVNNTFSVQVPSFAPGLSVRDLARAVGDLNLSGNAFSPAGTNLTISKNVGQAFSFGRNAVTSKNNPHIISQPALTPASFNYIFRDGIGSTTVSSTATNINPLNFDNGTGTLGTVGVNDYAYQQFLLFPNSNNVFIQYGSTTFNTMDEAVDNLSTTTFPVLPGFTSAMRRGVMIVKRGTTNLSDTANARFFVADKFGSIAGAIGAGASAGGDMLASVYDPAGGAKQVAFDDSVVKLTTNQSVAGIKTFTSSPIVPVPTTEFGSATKGYVDGNIEATTRESNTVLFDKDYTIGQAAARTGDVLIDVTGAKKMAVTTMLHNDAAAFGFFLPDGTTPFVFNQEVGTYSAGVDNWLDFQYLWSGAVRLTISQ